MGLRIEGYVIVSADGMLADAGNVMADDLKFEGLGQQPLVAHGFQFVRPDVSGDGEHAASRDYDIVLDTQPNRRRAIHHPRSYARR